MKIQEVIAALQKMFPGGHVLQVARVGDDGFPLYMTEAEIASIPVGRRPVFLRSEWPRRSCGTGISIDTSNGQVAPLQKELLQFLLENPEMIKKFSGAVETYPGRQVS